MEKLQKILTIETVIMIASWFLLFGILGNSNVTEDLIVGFWASAWTASVVIIALIGFPEKVPEK